MRKPASPIAARHEESVRKYHGIDSTKPSPEPANVSVRQPSAEACSPLAIASVATVALRSQLRSIEAADSCADAGAALAVVIATR